jgi:sulfite exporter TauE/SafE
MSDISKKEINWLSIPVGLLLVVLFVVLQRFGFVDFGFGEKIKPVTALLVGVVASFSSCLLVVGGLVLSLSSTVVTSSDVRTSRRVFGFFHAGRILGFAFLGGVLGYLGGKISISPYIAITLGILTASIMIILGLRLLNVLTKSVTMSKFIFDKVFKKDFGMMTPFLVGVGTFFLPCGFTQSMQMQALFSGSFVGGAMIMLAFVVGTFPVLALLSFGVTTLTSWKYKSFMFEVIGVMIVVFGMITLWFQLALLDIVPMIFIF